MRKVGHLGPLVAERTLMRELRKKRIEIYRRWGCGLWKNYLGLAQLPIFLAIMEALRAMSGAKQGWWGMLSGATAGADRTEAVLTADGLVSTALIPVESTFAIEGALWFPNLLLPDPQLALPFMLSGAILLNIFGHRPAVIGKWQKRFTRNMGLIALAIGPIMINVPSALLCYWVSSSMLAYGQALLLGRFMPIKKPVTPCKPKKLLKSGLGLPVKTKS
jgi:inner membrane protein COX18